MYKILGYVLNVYLYLMLMNVIVMFGNLFRIIFKDNDGFADLVILISTCFGIIAVGVFAFKCFHDTLGEIMLAMEKLHNWLVNG